MGEISITYGRGEQKTLQSGQTGADLIAEMPEGKKKRIVALEIGEEIVDLMTPLTESAEAKLLMVGMPETLEVVRHSTSHIMAQAVQSLFPGTQVTIGPAIENGFYYDFDTEHTFTPDDLPKIEKKMAEIIKADVPFTRTTLPIAEAVEKFKGMGEAYKVELIEDLATKGETEVGLYEHHGWVDLCRGPHLPSTGKVPAMKLMSIAGAYWRGDEKNKMLQRIYGTAFTTEKELKSYLAFLEEAKRRDHRVLAKELGLFQFSDEAGAGLPIFLPNGGMLRSIVEDFDKQEHFKRGYEIVYGPTILKKDLWIKSGHFDHYRDNMYFTEIDGVEYGIKPMNCLAHMLIFKNARHSYRDLPKRYFELGTVHRHEKSGVLHGLARVRAFTQDDAHIICTPDQLDDEIKGVVRFVQDVMAVFGFEYEMEISTRPDKAIGSDEMWDTATLALKTALDDLELPYEINEGDGAFYGPKIDVKLRDSLNREWQCATIQCDFAMPERFDLTYIGEDGQEHRPVMIHRVILGSIERFVGVLIEHFAGVFPTWLAPVQAAILTVTDAANDWAKEVQMKLREQGIRVEVDLRNEKIGYKIRHWQKLKVPYMLVVGEKEAESQGVSPRTRKNEDLKNMPLEQFVDMLKLEVAEKRL
jgi:threonyl-tRNA synthetase